jgi:hypothetical protein
MHYIFISIQKILFMFMYPCPNFFKIDVLRTHTVFDMIPAPALVQHRLKLYFSLLIFFIIYNLNSRYKITNVHKIILNNILNLYNNICVLEQLGHKLRTKIYTNALKLYFLFLFIQVLLSFISSFQHIKS